MQNSNINIPATGLKIRHMDNQASSVESLFERVKNYGETRIELLKLKAIDKSSSFLSVVITYTVVFIIFALFFIFFNIGLALLIGDLIGRSYYGFFILAVFYAVVGIVLLKNRNKWMITRLINMIVKT